MQIGPTSIQVSWTSRVHLGDITGYTISYTGGNSSVSVHDGNSNNYTLTGLQNGKMYIISIVATLVSGLPSRPLEIIVSLGMSKIDLKVT